jgi:hypothetical protein
LNFEFLQLHFSTRNRNVGTWRNVAFGEVPGMVRFAKQKFECPMTRNAISTLAVSAVPIEIHAQWVSSGINRVPEP